MQLTLDLLSAGMTNQKIMEDYPAIEEADIKAYL